MYLSKLLLLLLSPFRRRTCIWMLLVPLFPGLAYPSSYFRVAFSLHLLLHVMSDRLKKGRGRTRRRKGKWKKRNSPPFFSRSPTFIRRLPPFECLDQGIHSGSILLFLGFKENTELGWKSATLIFFFKGAKVRPVSNVVLLPCRTQLIEEIRLKHGSSAADVWNQVVLLPWSTARLAVLKLVFIFVFCFRQQSFCSTELNSTSETLGRANVVLQSGATVKPA